MKESEMT